MASSRRTVRAAAPKTPVLVAGGVLGLGCTAAVASFGELAPGSLVAVVVTGALIAGWGLARRAGAGSPPVGRAGLPWLALLVVAGSWELVALADGEAPTVSDLADPVLASPPMRAAATLGWLVVGVWLVTRPGRGQVSR